MMESMDGLADDGNAVLIGYLPLQHQEADRTPIFSLPPIPTSENPGSVETFVTGVAGSSHDVEHQTFQIYVPATVEDQNISNTMQISSDGSPRFSSSVFLSTNEGTLTEDPTSKMMLFPLEESELLEGLSGRRDGGSEIQLGQTPQGGQTEGTRRLLNLDVLTQQLAADNRAQEAQRLIDAKKKSFMPRCETCDELLKCVSQFRAHSRKCRPMKQFECEKCGEGFNQRLNYDLHLATHSLVSRDGMLCPACGKEFSRLASFKCHLTLHRVDDSAVCDICREEFPYYTELKKHVRLSHIRLSGEAEDEDSYVFCKECGLVLETDEDLKSHRVTHRKIRESMRLTSKKKRKGGRKGRPGQDHQCTLCHKVLSSHSALQRHKVIHTGQKPYECTVCGKRFSQKGSLMFHETIHLKKKPYSCRLCGMGFTQRGNLRTHVERLHPANVSDRPAYRCPFCACIFKTVQSLNVHLSKRHQEVSENNPQNMDKIASAIASVDNLGMDDSLVGDDGRVRRTSDLLKDAIAESGIDPVFLESEGTKNDKSGKQLAAISQKLLKRATVELLRRHTKKQQKVMGDSLCGSQSKGVRMIVEEGKRKWMCPECPQKSTRGSDIVRHMRTHTGERPYKCDMCGKAYALRSTLQQHLRHHLGMSAERCHICLKTLSTPSALRKHLKLHNKTSCPLCGDSFSSLLKLKAHTEKFHSDRDQESPQNTAWVEVNPLDEPLVETKTGELVSANPPTTDRQNRCHLCPAAYRRLKHLKDHMKTAHGPGPNYHCRQCGRWFLTSRYLRDHLKRHSGRKPFICPLCPKAFVTKGGLTRHSLIHSLHKPFICPYCRRRFKRGVQCRKHIKTLHKDSPRLPPPHHMVDYIPYAQEEHLPLHPVSAPMEAPPPQPSYFMEHCPQLEEQVYNSHNENGMVYITSSVQKAPEMQAFESAENGGEFLDLSSVIGGVLSPDPGLSSIVEIPEHFPSTSGGPEMAWSCPICEEPTVGLDQFAAHIGSSHSKARGVHFNCPACGELTKGSHALLGHVQLAHKDQFTETNDELNDSVNSFSSQLAKRLKGQPDSKLDGDGDSGITISREDPSNENNGLDDDNVRGLFESSLKSKTCHLCNKGFRKASDLQRHLRIHTGEKPFPCSLCGKSFRVKSTLTSHLKTHSDEIPNSATHVCQVCNKEFMSRGSLKVHLRIHTNEKPFQCELCSESFRTSSGRKSHWDKEHSLNPSRGTKMTVLTAENLDTVLVGNVHNTNQVQLGKSQTSAFNPVASRRTDDSCVGGGAVQRLSLSVKPDPNGLLQVEVRPLPVGSQTTRGIPDSEVIIEVSTLQELVAQGMVLNIPLSSNSSSLSQVTVDPVHLLESLERQGMPLTSAQEESNDQSLVFNGGSALHLQTAEDLSLEKFIVECRICDLNFRTPEESMAHFQSEDHETALFTAGHVRSDRKFPCQYCVKAFEHKWKLDRHVRIHSKARPFICQTCGKTFNQREVLQKHVDGVHLNKRNFTCDTCGKTFQHKWNLTRHWRTTRNCGQWAGAGTGEGPVVVVQPRWEESGLEKSLLLSL